MKNLLKPKRKSRPPKKPLKKLRQNSKTLKKLSRLQWTQKPLSWRRLRGMKPKQR